MDESPDARFYSSPRFVQHIDEGCITRLKTYYGDVIRAAGREKRARVLDLCSSWTSHLPDELLPGAEGSPVKNCVGVGMNEKELEANKHLTSYIVRDLNTRPALHDVESGSVDVVICSVSIDYMTKPVELLSEVKRVLRHGGTCHCSFSNRCFPTKVVGKWLKMDDDQRRSWVGGYFWASSDTTTEGNGGWREVEEVVLLEGGWEDPLYVVRATKSEGEEEV